MNRGASARRSLIRQQPKYRPARPRCQGAAPERPCYTEVFPGPSELCTDRASGRRVRPPPAAACRLHAGIDACLPHPPPTISRRAAPPAEVVNDFSIQVATVNGSGSQTANLVLLRSIFQMGIPVSGKNLFPSNIAGLPTWYTIRASKHGYIGRKKEIDFLVAMNPETAQRGRADARPGRRRRLRRAAEAQRAAHRPRVLPGAVRQAGRAGLPRRQAAPPRAQHDLRRRPREAARHRHGRDGEGARQAARQEGQGRRAEPGRARRRAATTPRQNLPKQRSVPRRAR